jgi:hypothetical protein
MFDPAYVADQLTGAQQRRVLTLARSQKSLPWTRTDDALAARGLVQRYTDPFDKAYAELKGWGQAVARAL